jgi:O-antigen ligase
MKGIFLIKDTLANRVSYYHLLAFLLFLPFDRLYSELVLGSFVLHSLIHFQKNSWRAVKLSSVLLPVSIYLLTCMGTLYTNYRDEAFYEWERQLAILLFPLLFVFTSLDLPKYRLPLLKGLALSCVLTIVYLYINAVYLIWVNHLPLQFLFTTAFLNHNFSEPVDMHATYFSMYIALSASALVYLLVKTQDKNSRMIYIIGVLILFAGILQLSSRAVFIALLININMVVPFFLLKRKKMLVFLAISLGFSIVIIAGIFRNDVFKARYITGLKSDLTQQSINLNILEPRAQRWACAWELIKESPLTGHGSGSEIALLKEKYYTRQYYNSYINELNAHGQFLSLLVKTGVPGLLLFLLVLFNGFKKSIRSGDMIFCSFLVIIAIVSFSENILDANKGIFFFAFFYSLFYLSRPPANLVVIEK